MTGFIDGHRGAYGVEPICAVLPIAPSTYYEHKARQADAARLPKRARADAGLGIIPWTLERSGLLKDGGGWYYQSVSDVIDNDGDAYVVLDVLARDVGILGIFSDWPATATYYGNCMGFK